MRNSKRNVEFACMRKQLQGWLLGVYDKSSLMS